MILKNGAQHMPRCLESVRGLAGESIVADTGSPDATPSIAARYGTHTIPSISTIADFVAARNHGIKRAAGRSILVVDADETLDLRRLTIIFNQIKSIRKIHPVVGLSLFGHPG